jgi:hypothetical protein
MSVVIGPFHAHVDVDAIPMDSITPALVVIPTNSP